MGPGAVFRYSLWEFRGSLGRIWVWVLCLSVGVGAVVSIAGLASSLDRSIRGEARKLLAADLAVRSRAPISTDALDAIDRLPGAARAEVRELAAMIGRASPRSSGEDGPTSALVELKAVSGGYPFYGELRVEPPLPAGMAPAAAIGDHSALVAPEVLARLDLAVGDEVRLGRRTLRIAGVLEAEPDRLPTGFAFGPRVIVGVAAQEASGVFPFAGFGGYRVLVRLPAESSVERLELIAETLRLGLRDDGAVRVETYVDAQPGIRRDLDRMERYLGLVALLSLLVGGVGVAQGIRAWLLQRLDALAVLKCLGARPRDLLRAYLVQALVLGCGAGVLGGAVGLLSILLVPAILGGALPTEAISIWQPLALVRGIVLGIGVSVAFSAPALMVVLRVPPVRVFRRIAEPLPGSRKAAVLSVLVVAVGVAATAAVQAGSPRLALQFLGALAAAVAGLCLAALLVRAGARVLAPLCRRYWLRHGVAALARPDSGTLPATVALGMGLMVLLVMFVVQGHLRDQLLAELPDEAPSAFLLNVSGSEWSGLKELLGREGARRVQSAPVVLGRVLTIDGDPVEERTNDGNRWALRRQLRLTYLDELPADNVIVAAAGPAAGAVTGASPWVDPAIAEVTVEQEFAETIGVGVGSVIALDVADRKVEVTVTSLRQVDWEGFGINFFLVVEPAVLDWAPHTRLAAAWLPPERELGIQDAVYRAHPGVAVVRIREMLQKVVELIRNLELGVRVLGSFTVAAALLTLAGAVAAGSLRRGREVALLKTIGSTRFDVLRAFAAEYALIGLSASVVAAVLGSSAAWWLVTRQLELEWSFRPLTVLVALLAGVLLSLGTGILASAGALRRPPIDSLREAP